MNDEYTIHDHQFLRDLHIDPENNFSQADGVQLADASHRIVYANLQEAFVASMEHETERERGEADFWRKRCAEERENRIEADKQQILFRLVAKDAKEQAKWAERIGVVCILWAAMATLLLLRAWGKL